MLIVMVCDSISLDKKNIFVYRQHA